MLGLGVGATAALGLPGAVPGLPVTGPKEVTKLVFEGDSISASAQSAPNRWIAANPSVPAANLAVSASSMNGVTNMTNRLPQVQAEAPSHFVVMIGTNDLINIDAGEYQSQFTTYIGAVKVQNPGVIVLAGLIPPADPAANGGSRAQLNARRAIINPWLRSQVGSLIDAIIAYGEHPILGPDAAGADTNLFLDGVHPTAAGEAYMLQCLQAVLDPMVAQATGSTPSAFTFADAATASASTAYTALVPVTGMELGKSATASGSGAGEFQHGTRAYGNGPASVMNGDIIRVRMTSSATVNATVQHTLTIGARSDIWDITTSPPTATTVFDQAGSHTSLTFTDDRHVYGDTDVNAPQVAFANQARSAGKHYAEFTFGPEVSVGIWQVAVAGDQHSNKGSRPGQFNSNGTRGLTYRYDGRVYIDGTSITGLPTFGVADTIGIALDADAGKVWLLKNGVSINGDPAAGTGGYTLVYGTVTEWRVCAVPQRADGHQMNCGQDAFNFAPPAGFSAYG